MTGIEDPTFLEMLPAATARRKAGAAQKLLRRWRRTPSGPDPPRTGRKHFGHVGGSCRLAEVYGEL